MKTNRTATMKQGILLVLGLLALAGCELVGPDAEADLRELSASEKQVVRSDNRFGLNLFRLVSEEAPEANTFVSPFSIATALSMTLNGAEGETRAGMEKALEVHGLTREEINKSRKGLAELLGSMDPKVAFTIANSIWYREGFSVLPSFLDVNRTYFDAEVRAEDFADPGTAGLINGWVDKQTRGKIDEIIDGIDGDVMMYLINAIYFKGTWTYSFDKTKTTDQAFYRETGAPETVKMMIGQAEYGYAETDRAQVVDLPYGKGQYRMTVLLPKEGRKAADVVAALDDTSWQSLTGRLAKREVALEMPRFRMELKYEDEMKRVLSALGMGKAFTGQADFSGMTGRRDLYIGRVIHKTFVEVDEEGTEAAAVTAVEMRETSAGPDDGPLRVRLDRPFVFALREAHTGAILFIGKVMTVG